MKNNLATLLTLLALAGLVWGTYYYTQRPIKQEMPVGLSVPSPVSDQTPDKVKEPAVRYPVRDAKKSSTVETGGAAPESMPDLGTSDATILGKLAGILGKERIENFLNPKDFIRRVVVSVDNATGPKLSAEYLVLRPANGKFTVTRQNKELVIGSANEQRYLPQVLFAQTLDAQAVVAVYRHFYPLFQQAYAELGNQSYFNDRLIEVIDHLLATPEAREPIKLVQKNMSYKYESAELEALSAGQKILIRIGPANAVRIKTTLKQLRDQLTGLNE